MRVLLITQEFHPEPCSVRGLPFARALVERGFDVEVLTGFPNYPAGRIYSGYRQRLCIRETVEGVTITRVPLYPSHDGSAFHRALTYLSMAASMALQGPFRVQPPDLVHVNQGPATLCLPAECIRLLRGCPILLDIQDLWPESVLDSGMWRWRGGDRLLHAWSRHTYRHARHIVTLSEGVKSVLIERGVPADKVTVLHNWCDPEREKPLAPRDAQADVDGLKETFNVMFAGNLGPLQALDTVLAAAAQVRTTRPRLRFVLVGSGLAEERLKDAAQRQGLDNVRFLPLQPLADLNRVLVFADAMLVHLKESALNHVGIPSKLQHALAVGRPVLAGVSGAAAELVQRAQAGFVFEPENAARLADLVCRLHDMPPAERVAMGGRGRAYYLENMACDIGMRRLTDLYQSLAAPRRPAT